MPLATELGVGLHIGRTLSIKEYVVINCTCNYIMLGI